MQLAITELTTPCLTRRRGRLAAEALLSRDDGDEIHLLLNGVEFLSLSFLDELVRHLEEAGVLGRLTFGTQRHEHVDKLGRVRDIREVDIYLLSNGERVLVEPKAGPTLVEAEALDEPPEEPGSSA